LWRRFLRRFLRRVRRFWSECVCVCVRVGGVWEDAFAWLDRAIEAGSYK
jgi:hypothetical protein